MGSLKDMCLAMESRAAYAKAERYVREALAGYQRIGLADSGEALFCTKELAVLRLEQGDAAEPVKLLEDARPRATKRFGKPHPLTLWIERVLVRALTEAGRLDEAESLGKATLEARRRVSLDQPGNGRTLLYLGRVLVEEGKLDEAEPLLKEALAIFREHVTERPELAVQAANWLGTIQTARKAYPQAEALMLPGSDLLFEAVELSPNERHVTVGHIVALYQAWGISDQEAEWRRKLDGLTQRTAKAL
jgi:tetratricopeptide (TPR) repeat protein